MTNPNETPNMDEINAAVAEDAASTTQFILHLSKPVMHDGEELTELSFDFDKLTGKDSLAVESELDRLGITLIVPAFNGQYLSRLAVRACTKKIGVDVLQRISIRDYSRIRTETRGFLAK